MYIVNNVDADVLATQRARASTAMMLTMLNRNNSVSACYELNSAEPLSYAKSIGC